MARQFCRWDPQLKIIAAWREWKFRGREDLIAYLKEKKVPVEVSPAKPWSRDRNLWHISHEGGILEDPAAPPPKELFMLTRDPADAPNAPDEVTIEFDQGTPVAVDSVPLGPVALVERLNEIAGVHGVGRADASGNRVVGMKSRGCMETPGGTVLRARIATGADRPRSAHPEPQDSRLSLRRTRCTRGRWWTPGREASMRWSTSPSVTSPAASDEALRGQCDGTRKSPYSLYSGSMPFSGRGLQPGGRGGTSGCSDSVRMTAQQSSRIGSGGRLTSAARPDVEKRPTSGRPLLGGRFEAGPEEAFDQQRSLPVDARLWPQDVPRQQGWVQALKRAGVLSLAEETKFR